MIKLSTFELKYLGTFQLKSTVEEPAKTTKNLEQHEYRCLFKTVLPLSANYQTFAIFTEQDCSLQFGVKRSQIRNPLFSQNGVSCCNIGHTELRGRSPRSSTKSTLSA